MPLRVGPVQINEAMIPMRVDIRSDEDQILWILVVCLLVVAKHRTEARRQMERVTVAPEA